MPTNWNQQGCDVTEVSTGDVTPLEACIVQKEISSNACWLFNERIASFERTA